MKKSFALLLCIAILLICVPVNAFAAEEKQSYAVALPDNPKDTEIYAAEILAENIAVLTGSEVPVLNESELSDSAAYRFFVGGNDSISSEPDGSYIINPIENGCEIYGAGNRGTVYGVYGFLHDYCGFRYYTMEMGMTTTEKKITLPKEKTEYTAFFERTDTDWHSPTDTDYSVANGLNGNTYRPIPPEKGGTVDYISRMCHTLTTQFCASETYFDEHPEYFALHDGKRTPNQLCLTNSEVLEIVKQEVFDILKDSHDPDASLQIISLTQHDNFDYCECENCKALDDANGSHQGTNLTFVNAVADAVKEAGYDNVAIDTFAYLYTRNAPSEVVPRDNVIVRLCTIECCFAHTLDDESCEENAALMKDLEDWNKICDRIYIWDYTTNYAFTAGIFPDFHTIQKNMQIFYEHGVKGIYEEGAYYVDRVNTEFGELRAYLLSRLLRDPYCDYDAEMEGFCNAFYGEGGKYIIEFINGICNIASERNHAHIFDGMNKTFTITKDEAKEFNALWEKAEKASAGDADCLANVKGSELSWRYVKSSLKLGEFSGLLSRYRENRILYNDLIDSGLTQFSEGGAAAGTKVAWFAFFLPADKWTSNSGKVLANPLYIVAGAIYAFVLVFALLVFIESIKRKKFINLVTFPLLLANIEAILWSRRAFLAWRDIDEYFITLGIFAAVVFFISFCLVKLNDVKVSKKIRFSFVYTLVFFVLYEAPLLIINNLIFKGAANNLALSVSFALCGAFILYVVSRTFGKLKKIPK